MSWVSAFLVLVLVLDGLRLRARLQRMPAIKPSNDEVAAEHVFLLAPGVSLPDSVKRDASAWARAEGLEALDLVPADLPVERLIGLMQVLDPAAYRMRPFAQGRTAGHAILAHRDVIVRAGLETTIAKSVVELSEMAMQLKQHAPRAMGHALAEGLASRSLDARELRQLTEILARGFVNAVLTGELVLLLLILLLAVWTPWGWLALAVFHLQPLIVLFGQRARPSDLGLAVALRWPLQARSWIRVATGPRRVAIPNDAKRAEYGKLLAGGLEGFFEPRRHDCPYCRGPELTMEVETCDLLQHKPGRFVLERCLGCGHVFQNPRLSKRGLDFYYRDFYEGLGEIPMESVFGSATRNYVARAEMIPENARPERWLDVGGGHGHFALAAKAVWPETAFDGLDQSSSIEAAAQRGWLERGYRGSFLELAPELDGYDVLSMSHYLEHTREPWAEIAAAAEVLSEGGYLIIEVPDPESALRKVLRRYWLPYFQPQHLHLIPARNLDRLLRRHAFEPMVWHRGPAHQPVDFAFAAWMLVSSLAGTREQPWRPKPTHLDRARRFVVWLGLFWLPPLGWFTDKMLARFLRREGWSNTYRVLARREPAK